MKDIRPDDLTMQTVQVALAKVPALIPRDIDDLMLASDSRRESGATTSAGAVAILSGKDDLPGTTVNRYCSCSLATAAPSTTAQPQR